MTQPSASSFVLGGAFLLEAADCENVFTPEDFSLRRSRHGASGARLRRQGDHSSAGRTGREEAGIDRRAGPKSGGAGLSRRAGAGAVWRVGHEQSVACLIEEQLGRIGSFAATCAAHTGIGTMPITYFGSEETKAKYLPKLATGEWLGAYCLSEAESGSDALSMRTKATLSDDGKAYVLNGSKMWITNAGLAHTYIVVTKMDGNKYGAFVVERTFPGLSIEKEEHKLGICGSSTCRITLDDCRVPRENLLGEPGKGHLIAFNILNMGRYKLGAATLGAAKEILRLSATYATERKQFGKPIGQFGLDSAEIGPNGATGFCHGVDRVPHRRHDGCARTNWRKVSIDRPRIPALRRGIRD